MAKARRGTTGTVKGDALALPVAPVALTEPQVGPAGRVLSGAAVRARREALGLTQAKLVNLTMNAGFSLSVRTLSSIECGNVDDMALSTALAICYALECEIGDLLAGSEVAA